MMDESALEHDFRKKVCGEIRLVKKSVDRYFVRTPFMFNDGDVFKIILKKDSDARWILSDEGHTMMHLSYLDMDLKAKTRQKVINDARSMFNIEDRSGELVIVPEKEEFGEALYSMVQGILHITDVEYLNRENVRSTFMDDLKIYLQKSFPVTSIHFDYRHPTIDPKGHYLVDSVIQTKGKPIFVYGVMNDDQCKLATMSILWYKAAQFPFLPIAVFEDMGTMGKVDMARLTDAAIKQYSSLDSAEKGMIDDLKNIGCEPLAMA
ncbi:MAG: DUF1828 domain-containing protein [Methanomassiliicoccales archaeon]